MSFISSSVPGSSDVPPAYAHHTLNFIHPRNQSTLWKVLRNHPHCRTMSANELEAFRAWTQARIPSFMERLQYCPPMPLVEHNKWFLKELLALHEKRKVVSVTSTMDMRELDDFATDSERRIASTRDAAHEQEAAGTGTGEEEDKLSLEEAIARLQSSRQYDVPGGTMYDIGTRTRTPTTPTVTSSTTTASTTTTTSSSPSLKKVSFAAVSEVMDDPFYLAQHNDDNLAFPKQAVEGQEVIGSFDMAAHIEACENELRNISVAVDRVLQSLAHARRFARVT